MLSDRRLLSLIELPVLEMSPGIGNTAGLITADKQVRAIIRDISGKICWDISPLYLHSEETPLQQIKSQGKIYSQVG